MLNTIFDKSPAAIDEIIDYFDIDLWYEQKDPRKYHKLFSAIPLHSPDFWDEGYLKAFVSHLTSKVDSVLRLKNYLGQWGVSAFIAHRDIQPTREWQREIEVALDTMDVMIPVVEPGFLESEWCCQEVGYALGRNVDIIPLRVGLDPFGLFGKYQGLQAKWKLPSQIAEELFGILLRKLKHRSSLMIGVSKSFTAIPSDDKIARVRALDGWDILSDEELKILLERISLSDYEREELNDMILRVGAFREQRYVMVETDMPF